MGFGVTINDDLTMGGAAATLLAGRYRVVRQLGQGGTESTSRMFDCGRMKVKFAGAFDCSLWYNVR